MGEIGGNDYNHPFSQGKTGKEVQSFVPDVIMAIGVAINVSTNYYFHQFIYYTKKMELGINILLIYC